MQKACTPPVSKTIVAAKVCHFKEIIGERGLALPDMGFLQSQERYYPGFPI